ncbi:hypothetical protein [Halopenitus sp. POP-27]|uniref:hypothetical protein n=1 Tax=Halopenitus sp. POP-27 TaxID=2994425 RepID=UPI00246831E0|nr:hypothetical protein [Halopenitus sp. POP-27]
MVTQRRVRVYKALTRLLGAGICGVGIVVMMSWPVQGVVCASVGVVCAVRPYIFAELLEWLGVIEDAT